MILQSYFCYIVLRDLLITLNVFMKGDSSSNGTNGPNQAILAVVLIHYFSACLDNLVMTGLSIWGAVALNNLDAENF